MGGASIGLKPRNVEQVWRISVDNVGEGASNKNKEINNGPTRTDDHKVIKTLLYVG